MKKPIIKAVKPNWKALLAAHFSTQQIEALETILNLELNYRLEIASIEILEAIASLNEDVKAFRAEAAEVQKSLTVLFNLAKSVEEKEPNPQTDLTGAPAPSEDREDLRHIKEIAWKKNHEAMIKTMLQGPSKGLTSKQISIMTGLSRSTISNALHYGIDNEFIKHVGPRGKNQRFVVTEKGIPTIDKEARKNELRKQLKDLEG